MKKLFTLGVAIICSSLMLHAEVLKFNATSLAYKSQNEYGYWSDWSDWESCNILVVLNLDAERIDIYSSSAQEYDIYDYQGETYDEDGGTTMTLNCIDADGLRCEVRFRQQSDGQWQLYVDYADVMWVYNIQRK